MALVQGFVLKRNRPAYFVVELRSLTAHDCTPGLLLIWLLLWP